MQTVDYSRLPLNPGECLLDLGCGEGRHALGALLHQPQLTVIAIDIGRTDLECAHQRHREFAPGSLRRCLYTQADGLKLPLADHSIDHVVCSEVLEHIPAYGQIIGEIHRVLKPGGTLSVSVPRYWPEKICWLLSEAYHNVEGGHVRIFKQRHLQTTLEALPLTFDGRHWAHALHAPYWWLRCAFWSRGESFFITHWYHRLLVWDLLQRPRVTRWLERMLNPIVGKSLVMYFTKPNL